MTIKKKTSAAPKTVKPKKAAVKKNVRSKQAEELRVSEERYRVLFNAAPGAIILLNLDGYITDVNPAALTMSGYTADDLLNKHFSELAWFGLERAPQFKELFARLVKGEKIPPLTLSARMADGELKLLEILFNLICRAAIPCEVQIIVRDMTERKQAEMALRENEQNLRILFETMTEGIALNECIYDENGEMVDYRILNVNHAFYKTANYQGRNVVGATATKLYGMTPEFIKEFWKQHKKKNATAYTEMPSPVSNRWFFVATSPFVNDRFVTSFFDITERRQAELALRESEIKLKSIFEGSQDAIGVSLKGRHVIVNPAYVSMFGYASAEELIHVPVIELIAPESRAFVMENIRVRSLGGDAPTAYETVALRKDGSTFSMDVRVSAYELNGQSYSLVILRDITERKQVENALRASQERYQAFIAQSFEAISRTEFDHPIDTALPVETQIDLIYENAYMAECNQAMADMYNMPAPETFIGVRLIDAHGGKDNPVNRAVFRKFIENGYKSMNDETLEYTADGKPVWFLSNTVGTLENGLLVRLWGTAIDITERKQAEEKILKLNDELEQRVADRTRELLSAQDQLVQKEKLAVLGQIAGSVGHELLNPLGVISNAVYFLNLAQPDADQKIKEYLSLIEKHIRISDNIVSDLLGFTRTKSPERGAVSILQSIQQTLERFSAPANVQVTLDLAADAQQVYADPQHFGQILDNLVLNACQIMEVKGGALTISTSRAAAGMIRIAVQDTGTGISPEHKKRLFEPLFTTKIKGIGLGLAVCKKLVEANDGSIEVESDGVPGKGSTFIFYLPVYPPLQNGEDQ